ncbi:epoxide hydrolase family protein [Mycolicibacterium sp. P9-22]|uniref:epoxide hydrolase family protein n=1 Tax=Mycolicibacterium sp. P9-22 TaxID=2024613 RepID=UPI0011EFCD5E|nr:epoxide hydrolase family protein [Mycolicibacterium sp. P9-22]KAA0120636.1 epoxide hydrolase [Mycolicibacterium sp. P9-22]
MIVERFEIGLYEADVKDLQQRLASTRWPAPVAGTGWSAGTDLDYLRDLCAYWEKDFDWPEAAANLNRWTQFTTNVDGQRIHFLHVRSAVPGARPLMLLHGWPSSVQEFTKVVEPLTDPVAHGGDPADAFDVVIPSLPGYAWSGPTTQPGWDVERIAGAMTVVMERIGYDRYGLMGGDWGSLIASRMALAEPDRVSGLYLTLVSVPPLNPEDEPTPEEQRLADVHAQFMASEGAYGAIQATKPQSLAVGLNDSPAGLAAWIVEKFRAWTDCDGELESVVSRDDLLANLTAYWLTGTAGSSARLYYEALTAGSSVPVTGYVGVPTGVGVYPKELYRASRRQVERLYNVRRWTELARGGHFPALEQPHLFVGDIRAFFQNLS